MRVKSRSARSRPEPTLGTRRLTGSERRYSRFKCRADARARRNAGLHRAGLGAAGAPEREESRRASGRKNRIGRDRSM
jgi:hypothetical protein